MIGAHGVHYLSGREDRRNRSAGVVRAGSARHLLRTDGFAHVADLMIGSFYDPDLDEGCAFEELISFHGGIGGSQTRAFILLPASCRCRMPPSPGPQPSTTAHGLAAAPAAPARTTGRRSDARL